MPNSAVYSNLPETAFRLSDLLFSDNEIEQVSKLLQFRDQSEKSSVWVPYNILIISDDDNRGAEYCYRTILTANESSLFSKGFLLYSFDEYCNDKTLLTGRAGKYDIIAIHSIHEEDLDREEWHQFMQALNDNSPLASVYKIICLDPSAANKLREMNQHLFYRVFPDDYHIQLSKNIDDVEKVIFDSLLSELRITLPNYAITEEFQSSIREYINTVYPSATLRERVFVRDLRDRIIRSIFTKGSSASEIDASCVPFYRKRTDYKTVKDFFAVDESTLKEVKTPSKNVLILALSMFSGLLKKTYRYEKTGYTCTGYYQLDPIPRFLIDQILSENETLDEIIMFCTPETLTPSKKELNLPDKSGIIESFTAADYFEWSLKKDTQLNICFTRINLNEYDPKDAITNVVDHLRSLKQHSDLRVFFDTHGGFRGIQIVTEAILSLLAHENIHLLPNDVWTIYHSLDRKAEDIIRRDNEAYNIFSFVSGINEFVNYGRCASLEDYLKKDQKNIRGQTSDTLVECIREISEGIQLCNIPKFENGLDNIQACLTQLENTPPNELIGAPSYLSLFTQIIETDYKDLLVESSDKRNVVDEIRWCLKKGFLQQALTLIESKIPSLLHSDQVNVIQYEDDVRDFLEARKQLKPGNRKSDTTQFLINFKLGEILQYSVLDGKAVIKSSDTDFIEKAVLEFDNLNKKTNYDQKSRRPNKFISFKNNDAADDRLFFELKGRNLPVLLRYHYLFHELRNELNHASDNSELKKLHNPTLESAISRYLQLLNLIREQQGSSKECLRLTMPESKASSNNQTGNRQSGHSGKQTERRRGRSSDSCTTKMASLLDKVIQTETLPR